MSHFLVESYPEKCIACRMCEAACIAAHNGMTTKDAMKQRGILASRVHVIKSGDLKDSISCRFCENAPCVSICPTHALIQESNGNVISRTEICDGCGLCAMACPYGAIEMETREDTTKALRCDLCVDWRAANSKDVPACVEACRKKARALVEK